MTQKKLDFVGVGFPRCGTTWLSRCLRDHPEIAFAEDKNGNFTKEPHFFNRDYEYQKGLPWFFETYFSHAQEGQLCGEYTTTYFENVTALQRIKEHFPDVKIILQIRNPYDRAFSHFLYRKRKGGKPKQFKELFKNDPHKVVEWGHYEKYIRQIFALFPRENILVVNHDDHKKDSQKYIEQVYSFLGVDAMFVPESLYQDINRSKNLRYYFPWFQWVFALRYKVLEYQLGRIAVKTMKITGIASILIYLRGKNIKPNVDTDTEFLSDRDRERLKVIYKPSIEELEKFLKIDLTDWK